MKKTNLIILVTVMILTIFPLVLAQQNYNNGCGMMYGAFGGYGTGMMILSWITYTIIIILAIAGIFWIIKSANKKK